MLIKMKLKEFLRGDSINRKKLFRAAIQRAYGFLCFSVFNWRCSPVYVTYHPDSSYIFRSHPQFRLLLKSWLRHNRVNNGGDMTRYYSLMLNLKQTVADGILGDFAELGVWRGNSAAVLAHFASVHGRKAFLFDTFEGFDRRDLKGSDEDQALLFKNTSIDIVAETIGHSDVTEYIKGYFPDSVNEAARSATYAFVHIDCDLYEPMKAGLAFFYERMPAGGTLFLHDYSSGYWEGAKRAIDEFCKKHGESAILMPDKSGTAVIRKSRQSGCVSMP